MRLEEIERGLKNHPLFTYEIPVQMQLGLPYLFAEEGLLYLSYRLHRRQYRDGKLMVYEAQYEIESVYPFRRITYFSNRSGRRACAVKKPVAVVDGRMMAGEGRRMIEALYREADRLIGLWEKEKVLTKRDYENYQKLYRRAAEALYGG